MTEIVVVKVHPAAPYGVSMIVRGRHKYKKHGMAHLWRRNLSDSIRVVSECGQCEYLLAELVEDKEARLCKHCEKAITRK